VIDTYKNNRQHFAEIYFFMDHLFLISDVKIILEKIMICLKLIR